jgi:undecaprenyl-diphosphatase
MSALNVINEVVFQWIHNFSGRSVILDGLAIFFAQYLPYLLMAAFLLLVAYQLTSRRRFYVFAEGILAIILSRGIITNIIYYFYYHPRPFEFYGIAPLISESGASFPSGHAAWFFALAMSVWYVDRKWGTWFFALTVAMGIARIFAGVHWPLDVLGGALIGIASAMFIHWLLRWEGARGETKN